jgi:hypothetical protein
MTRIRLVGLAIVAVFALTAFASATAMAKNPVLVKAGTKAGFNGGGVTSKDSAVSFLQTTVTGAAKIECASEEDQATVTSTTVGEGMTTAVGKVTFKKCKLAVGGKCANQGTEEITGTVQTLLVWIGKESSKTVGTLVSIAPVAGKAGEGKGTLLSFVCAGQLVDNESSFIAAGNRKIGESFTSSKLIGKQSGGVQELKKDTENGKEVEDHLWANLAGSAFSESGEEINSEETYPESVELIEG